MMGTSTLTASTDLDSRVFLYEVEGLHQNDRTSQASAAIRSSSKMLIPVPFSRMSDFMQRMSRMGATIVAIHPPGTIVEPTVSSVQSPSAPEDSSDEPDTEE